jgi:hypothetical protein
MLKMYVGKKSDANDPGTIERGPRLVRVGTMLIKLIRTQPRLATLSETVLPSLNRCFKSRFLDRPQAMRLNFAIAIIMSVAISPEGVYVL